MVLSTSERDFVRDALSADFRLPQSAKGGRVHVERGVVPAAHGSASAEGRDARACAGVNASTFRVPLCSSSSRTRSRASGATKREREDELAAFIDVAIDVTFLPGATATSSNTRGGGASTHPAPGAAFLRSGDSCAQTVRKFVLPGVRKAIAELADTNSSVRRLQQGNFGLRFVIEVEVAAINGVCALDVVCEAILGGLENFEVPGLALEHEAGRGRVVLDDARTGSGGASSSTTSSRTVIKFGARRLRELVPVAETLGVFAKKTLEEADGEINQNEKVGVLFHPTTEEAACCALFVVFRTGDSVFRGMQGPIYTHYACEGDAVVRLSPETILQVPKMIAVRSSGC